MTAIHLQRMPAALLFALLLSGCYPHSHDYVLTQEFSGVLRKGGSPLSGATVSVSHTRGDTGWCVNPAVVAVTDDTGAFNIPAQTQTHHFTSMINPPESVRQLTSVCFEAQGKQKLGVVVLAPTDHRTKYVAVCDWDSPGSVLTQKPRLGVDEWGICSRGDVPGGP